MKNFSLFSGLGVFVCLSVGGRVDEWVLGQIKVSFMFYSRNSIYMYGAFVSFVSLVVIITVEFPCLVSVPPVLIYLFICPSEKVNLKTPANFKLGFVMFR